MKQMKEVLILDLLTMAYSSHHYIRGEQWAVDAVASAREILNQVTAPERLFITEQVNHGITAKSTEFFKANFIRLGKIIRIKGYRNANRDYWVEFLDKDKNTIRVSGFSWGYFGEGPHGLAEACKLIHFPLTLSEIAAIPLDVKWEVERGE